MTRVDLDYLTEWMIAQEDLMRSEARYRSLSEATFEAIFISEKGVCLDANQRAAELFGYDHNELIGISGSRWPAAGQIPGHLC